MTQLVATWPAEAALQRDWLLARGGLGAADGGGGAKGSAEGVRRAAQALHGPPSLVPAVAAGPVAVCSGSWLASGCKTDFDIRLQQSFADCCEDRPVGRQLGACGHHAGVHQIMQYDSADFRAWRPPLRSGTHPLSAHTEATYIIRTPATGTNYVA